MTQGTVDRLLDGRWTLFHTDMPAKPSNDVLSEATELLTPKPWGNDSKTEAGNYTWGYAKAETVAKLMYRVTKVDGIFEKVPEPFRGVFWIHGNAVSEELAVMHYSLWDEPSRQLLVPMAPFMWSWALGAPKEP